MSAPTSGASRPAAVAIREAERTDAPAIASLLGQLGYPATPEAVVGRLGRLARLETNRVFVAVADGTVIGMTTGLVRDAINRDEPFCRIASLVVADGHRGRGIGGRLVATVEEWARGHGCAVIEVTSGAHRPDAHRFYENLGYVEKPKRFVKNI